MEKWDVFVLMNLQKVGNLGRFEFGIWKTCEIWDIFKKSERRIRKMEQKYIVTNNAKTLFCFTIVFY